MPWNEVNQEVPWASKPHTCVRRPSAFVAKLGDPYLRVMTCFCESKAKNLYVICLSVIAGGSGRMISGVYKPESLQEHKMLLLRAAAFVTIVFCYTGFIFNEGVVYTLNNSRTARRCVWGPPNPLH